MFLENLPGPLYAIKPYALIGVGLFGFSLNNPLGYFAGGLFIFLGIVIIKMRRE